jgi:hypothetical protein
MQALSVVPFTNGFWALIGGVLGCALIGNPTARDSFSFEKARGGK